MIVIDASECIMGRLASSVAKSLLNGEQVHVINAEKAVISGTKDMIFGEYIEKRNLNHPRKGPFYPRMPHLMLKRAIRGMIPYQKPRGREAFKRLKVDVGTPISLKEEKPQTIDNAKMNDRSNYVKLGDVSKILGAKF
jgi:large subunit ribosomal protein L13|tara:strand:+ start:924 stop:1337 length:414 start_codon:yes stop_codon:yes gene_type:complete